MFHGLGVIYLEGLGSESEVLELLETLSKFFSQVFGVWSQGVRFLNSLHIHTPKFESGMWDLCLGFVVSEIFEIMCFKIWVWGIWESVFKASYH